MSALSQQIAAALEEARQVQGEWITFNEDPYRVVTKSVSGAQAGQQAVPKTFSIFIASTDPRTFNFNPLAFAPTTDIAPPQQGSLFIRNNTVVVVSAVKYINVDDDTVAIICETLATIWNVLPV